jgi:hypothetical protein
MDPKTVIEGNDATQREWWMPLAVVSGLLVVLSIAAALLLGPRGGVVEAPSAPLTSRIGLAARAALVALGSSEEEFEAARTELMEAFDARGPSMSDDTRNTLAENLEIIDAHIAAISEELSRDPDNPRLARLLAAAYQKELELLQKAAALPPLETGASDS